MAFDYGADDSDPDVVSAVADAIRADGMPKSLSDEEKALLDLERGLRLEENRRWHEQRQADREREQAVKAEGARREAAIAAAKDRERLQEERRKRIAHETRERELRDLQFRAAQHESWRRNVENAARNTLAGQARQVLIADLERHFDPPPPPPEPEIVYIEQNPLGSPHLGDPDFNPGYWFNKPLKR
jgi:hypothetical protein